MLFFSALAYLIIQYFRVITDFESGCIIWRAGNGIIHHRKEKVKLKVTLEKTLKAQ